MIYGSLKILLVDIQDNSIFVFDFIQIYFIFQSNSPFHFISQFTKEINSIFRSNTSTKKWQKGVTTEGKFHYEKRKVKVKKQNEEIDWSFFSIHFKSPSRDQPKHALKRRNQFSWQFSIHFLNIINNSLEIKTFPKC